MRKTTNVCFMFLLLLLGVVSPVVRAETVMGDETDDFDFDGLPGVQHDFKVYVHAGTEECFYQKVAAGAEFYARFEVLKGGDSNVDFYVRDMVGNNLVQKTGNDGFIHHKSEEASVYRVCVDNVFDRFGYKVVYIYIVSMVMHEWLEYQTELREVEVIAANFSTSLQSVETSIGQLMTSQSKARFNVVRDWYLASGNNYYVGMWSMIQCGLIVLAAGGQVYSLRRLFSTSTTTPTSKPRA